MKNQGRELSKEGHIDLKFSGNNTYSENEYCLTESNTIIGKIMANTDLQTKVLEQSETESMTCRDNEREFNY